MHLLGKACLRSPFPAQDPYVSPAAWFNGVFNYFFPLFTVSIRARPRSSVRVLDVGVPEQALHRDAHSPGKDVPPALLPCSSPSWWPCQHRSRQLCCWVWGCALRGAAGNPSGYRNWSPHAVITARGRRSARAWAKPGEPGPAPQWSSPFRKFNCEECAWATTLLLSKGH